jgi:general secretion pathway protein D
VPAAADSPAPVPPAAPTLAQPAVVPAKTSPRPPSEPAASEKSEKTEKEGPPAVAIPELPFQPKSPDYKVALTLDDVELPDLVRTIGQLTGRRFVVASTHAKGLKATLYAPEKVSVAEAYQAFLAVLQANALTVIPSGAFWKIIDTQDVTKQPTPVARAGEGATSEERYVTRVLRLHHVNAEDIATNVLGKFATHDASVVAYAPGNLVILTETGENIRRLQRILEDVDVAVPGDKVWFEPLNYVSAAQVQKELSEVFDLKSATGGGGGAGKAAANASTVDRLTRLVALDRPNALVIVGSEAAYARVLSFIQRIDLPASNQGAIHVVPLEHADAKKLVPAINEALQGAAGGGGGAKMGSAVEPLSMLESQVRVSAEETTNAILVTSSEHDFASVRDVIARLDKPRRQVYIECVVMDVDIEKDTGIGVQYHGIDSLGSSGASLYGGMNPFASASQPGAAATSSLTDTTLQALALGVRGPAIEALGMTIPAFGAFIQASTHTLDSDIMQTPHILATDNIPSEFHVTVNRSLQQNYPSYASLSSLTGGSSATGAASPFVGTAPAAMNYKPLGPQIKITPHLNESDDVRLDIVETISDTTGVPEGALGTLPFTERGATTTLTVHDQKTAVIGGLVADKISHETVKIPFLGDIPLLGFLFRHTNDTKEKTDLVLVLTPYIIRDQEDMRRIVERRMQERQDLLDHQALFSDRPWREAPFERTRGLLGSIRHTTKMLAEQQEREDALLPRPPKTHEPTEPIELPPTAVVSGAPAAPEPKSPPVAAARVER